MSTEIQTLIVTHKLIRKSFQAIYTGDIRDMGSIPGSGRSPGERNGNPFQYSCLGNPMDRGALWAIVHGVRHARGQTCKVSDMTE